MSCNERDCHDAVEHLWELIDRELDEHAEQRVLDHINRCQACYPQYDFHRAYRTFIAQRCRQSAPPAVRRRIFESLLRMEQPRD